MTFEFEGLNLEKLLRVALKEGICFRHVRRTADRCVRAEISVMQRAKLLELCGRYGWNVREVRADAFVRTVRLLRRRPMLAAGAVLGAALIALSSQMILSVDVAGAGEYEAEVHRYLKEEGALVGRLKHTLSLDRLREGLLLRLPGLSYAGLRYAGSVLEVECQLARSGDIVLRSSKEQDLFAAQSGVITKLVVFSGTPLVRAGDAVYAGQMLVRGEERAEKGSYVPVSAQAQVFARVWAQGTAKVSLTSETASETGRKRTRVTIATPWSSHIVKEAQPFDEQEAEVREQPVIDLFIPLFRRTEVFSEISVSKKQRSPSDAASLAQGAAEKLAKKQLPPGALILDKWVDYSMIDNEFVYASVVLEYEQDIAVCAAAQ